MQTMSIHIGLNQVDPKNYCDWQGDLPTCEADATAMAELAAAQGIARRVVLLTRDATYERVCAEFRAASAVLQPGDYLLVTFAGHGTHFDDVPAPSSTPARRRGAGRRGREDVGDEEDGRDEAWCLYDVCILDDEIHHAFCQFAPGVRICVVSDSCYSGTVTRDDQPGHRVSRRPGGPLRSAGAERGERRMTRRLANALYRRDFAAVYQPRRLAVAAAQNTEPGAHVVLLAACGDDQTAGEGNGHGLFTEHVLRMWNGGQYTGSHSTFIDQIKAAMPPRQQPRLFVSGAHSPRFLDSRPFTPGD